MADQIVYRVEPTDRGWSVIRDDEEVEELIGPSLSQSAATNIASDIVDLSQDLFERFDHAVFVEDLTWTVVMAGCAAEKVRRRDASS